LGLVRELLINPEKTSIPPAFGENADRFHLYSVKR